LHGFVILEFSKQDTKNDEKKQTGNKNQFLMAR